ncbi:MAG: hypothetical protein K0B11_02785 [Mariniphaga sp.]|nr:hypothetical protein [Mariniphaga sp.]
MKKLIVEGYGVFLEIWEEDLHTKMTKVEAEKVCSQLGEGWRLPDREEMEVIYDELFRKNEGNFKSKGAYWISDLTPDDFLLSFDFREGTTYMSVESSKEWVRPVKTLD